MDTNRRSFLRSGFLATAGLLSGKALTAAQQHTMQHHHPGAPEQKPAEVPIGPPGDLGVGVLPVETPDLPKLPWQMDGGVKVFHLVAEPVEQEFLPGRRFNVWGYNGSVPGLTIEANQGDRVRIVLDNHLPEPTAIHWHGLEIPIEMDGGPGISQDLVEPGGRYVYEFTVHQAGTFFYHSHLPMQEMLGQIGLFILHPREAFKPRVDRDFAVVWQEWAVLPSNSVPNSMSMEFNWLTINGKSGPACTPLLVRQGERVRIRMVNLGMDHHPIHLHGNTFFVTGTEAGRVPESAWRPENTVLLGVAQARDIEFNAKYAGDWMLHCHLPHHMMNHMASMVGPLTHTGEGMHSSKGMKEGMGIMQRGGALAEENGPSLGRGMGHVGDYEKVEMNHAGGEHAGHGAHIAQEMKSMPGMQHERAKSVPGYPQDMFMTMDEDVAKPETYGLREGWTGAMMGMMTLVRVLPPELYKKIRSLQAQARSKQS